MKDGRQEHATVTVDDKVFDFATSKDVEEFFDTHPDKRREFLENPETFQDKYGKKSDSSEVVEEPEKPEKPEKAEVPETKTEPEPKPEPKPEPDFLDAISERDKRIEALNKRLDSEKAAFEERIKRLETPKPEKTQPEEKIPDLPELPVWEDDIELISDAGQAKVKEQIKALRARDEAYRKRESAWQKRHESLSQKFSDVESKIGEVKTGFESVKERNERLDAENKAVDELDNEFTVIDKMRTSHKDIFGESKRSAQEIETEYIGFIGDLLKLSGSAEPTHVPGGSGQLSDAAIKVLKLYNDEKSEAGKAFRERAEKKNVKYPEDFDSLQRVYDVRAIRNNRSPRDKGGNVLGYLSYDDAVELYRAANIDKIKMDESAEALKRHEKAVSKLKEGAKETPTKEGANAFDLTKISEVELNRISHLMPDERTKDEKEIFKQAYRAMGIPDAEIASLNGE